uniref:Uncharacterized protein LOC111099830 isoform X2 n=1 Tax=Crassostrea virginica TaxID=6565 RepID=A0A8B8A8S2_CRAVI|nr:uncharacterized protein LOC111099830 isoform X2 [Crassostrea virginica]
MQLMQGMEMEDFLATETVKSVMARGFQEIRVRKAVERVIFDKNKCPEEITEQMIIHEIEEMRREGPPGQVILLAGVVISTVKINHSSKNKVVWNFWNRGADWLHQQLLPSFEHLINSNREKPLFYFCYQRKIEHSNLQQSYDGHSKRFNWSCEFARGEFKTKRSSDLQDLPFSVRV